MTKTQHNSTLPQTHFQSYPKTGGPPQNGLKEAINFWQKTPFFGEIFIFFPFDFLMRPDIRAWVHSIALGPPYRTQV